MQAIKSEADLPPDAKLDDDAIDDEAGRAGLRKIMEGGLSKPVGYVLPLRRAMTKAEGGAWLSEVWRFKRKRLFLVPGDSPVGLRLPLASLPPLEPKDYPYITPVDPYEERGPLRTFDAIYRLRTPAAPAAKDPSAQGWPQAAACAHRPVRRAARRRALRFHAAAGPGGGLPRAGRPS